MRIFIRITNGADFLSEYEETVPLLEEYELMQIFELIRMKRQVSAFEKVHVELAQLAGGLISIGVDTLLQKYHQGALKDLLKAIE